MSRNGLFPYFPPASRRSTPSGPHIISTFRPPPTPRRRPGKKGREATSAFTLSPHPLRSPRRRRAAPRQPASQPASAIAEEALFPSPPRSPLLRCPYFTAPNFLSGMGADGRAARARVSEGRRRQKRDDAEELRRRRRRRRRRLPVSARDGGQRGRQNRQAKNPVVRERATQLSRPLSCAWEEFAYSRSSPCPR